MQGIEGCLGGSRAKGPWGLEARMRGGVQGMSRAVWGGVQGFQGGVQGQRFWVEKLKTRKNQKNAPELYG